MLGPVGQPAASIARIRPDAQPDAAAVPQTAQAHRDSIRQGVEQCGACAGRTYVDGSNDPGVSFKTPAHVSAGASFAAVSAHEGEHVSNERGRAAAEERQVVSQSVVVYNGICAECGRVYAAGGVTRTVTKSVSRPDEQPGARFDARA
jgi:hypothetical protein